MILRRLACINEVTLFPTTRVLYFDFVPFNTPDHVLPSRITSGVVTLVALCHLLGVYNVVLYN